VRLLELWPLLAYCTSMIVKMIVEKQTECRLAGETEVLGENMPPRHFCPSQNPTWLDLGLNRGHRGGKLATNRLELWRSLEQDLMAEVNAVFCQDWLLCWVLSNVWWISLTLVWMEQMVSPMYTFLHLQAIYVLSLMHSLSRLPSMGQTRLETFLGGMLCLNSTMLVWFNQSINLFIPCVLDEWQENYWCWVLLLIWIGSLTDLIDAVTIFTKGDLEEVQFSMQILLVTDDFDSVC
jgi:hypothetical protein